METLGRFCPAVRCNEAVEDRIDDMRELVFGQPVAEHGDAIGLEIGRDDLVDHRPREIDVEALERRPVIDQRALFSDNSVLRGQAPQVDEPVPN